MFGDVGVEGEAPIEQLDLELPEGGDAGVSIAMRLDSNVDGRTALRMNRSAAHLS